MLKQRIVISLIAVLLLNMVVLVAGATPIFVGDFETGDFSQWDNVCQSSPNSVVSISSSPIRFGDYAASFFLNNSPSACGGERAEISNHTYEKEGDEYYYSWSTMFPANWTTDTGWGSLFLQWHSFNDRSPPLAFIATESSYGGGADKIILAYCTGNVTSSCSYHNEVVYNSLARGLWHDFIMHVKWSGTTAGQVEVWHKLENQTEYIKVLNVTDRATLSWKKGDSSDRNNTIHTIQQGLYRSSSVNFSQIIYHDGFTKGTTYESVKPINTITTYIVQGMYASSQIYHYYLDDPEQFPDPIYDPTWDLVPDSVFLSVDNNEMISYLEIPSEINTSKPYEIHLKCYSNCNTYYRVYNTTGSFYYTTLSWANKPNVGSIVSNTSVNSSNEWTTISISSSSQIISLNSGTSSVFWMQDFWHSPEGVSYPYMDYLYINQTT